MHKFTLKSTITGILLATTGTMLSFSEALLADAEKGDATAPLKEDMPYLFVVHKGRSIKIIRDINRSFKIPSKIRNSLMFTSDACPPFCLQPLTLDDLPVKTVAEAEIIDFMSTQLRDNKGILIDVRHPKRYVASTIPGSVNYFIQMIQKGAGDEAFDSMLKSLGAKRRDKISWLTQQMENIGLSSTSELTENWDFTQAKELILWGESATDKTPVDGIRVLLKAGYPAHKIHWYHSGIASWTFWGFSTYNEPKQYK